MNPLFQVKIWRRSFDVPPPPMEPDHPYYKAIREDPRYKDGPKDTEFPTCESLKLTIGTFICFFPFFHKLNIFDCKDSTGYI